MGESHGLERKASVKQLKIAVGLPHYQGRSSFEHGRMWMQFGHTLACSEERFSLVSFSLVDVCGIDRARNECIAGARKGNADWLLMVDGDTWVSDGGDLLQMISDADKVDATIVGAAVPRRTLGDEGRTLMVYSSPERGQLVSLTEAHLKSTQFDDRLSIVNQAQWKSWFESFCPVDAMATACIAINLRHVEFMDEPFFRFTHDESEDIDFCRRVREMRGGWMKLDDAGRPHPEGETHEWKGHILIDKRVKAYHLNRPAILEGL